MISPDTARDRASRLVELAIRAGADAADAVAALDDEGYRELLQSRFGYRLGRIGRIGKRDKPDT